MNIALTFDVERDIPNLLDTYIGLEDGLGKIIEIMDRFGIKGTFFWNVDAAKKFPDILRSLTDNGHEIASHGMYHERLTNLKYQKCKETISQSKKILENLSNSQIFGFRAPYLKTPNFLFQVLEESGYKYDSSLPKFNKKQENNNHKYQIYEYPPYNFNFYFRVSFLNLFLKRTLKKRELTVLFAHPWEAIDIKKLLKEKTNRKTRIKNLFIRPDRWKNTGDKFLKRFERFIKEYISKEYKFIILKEIDCI